MPKLTSSWQLFIIDKNTSIAIKGIACVFVLMGHYGTWCLRTGEPCGLVTIAITHTTANVALAWFMFFSGFGLSLKTYGNENILTIWFSRFKKLYMPLLYVCLCTAILYMVFPYKEGANSSWYENLYHISSENIWQVIYYGLGLEDWYVRCIIYFVTIFYLSVFIQQKLKCNLSIVLSILLLCYIVVAYFVYGSPQAHYYRYPWAFMLGNIVASHCKNSKCVNISIIILFFLTWGLLDKISIACYLMAVFSLLILSKINWRFEFKGKALLFLGSISYFFYLAHMRIGWELMCILCVKYKSVILWIVITILSTFLLNLLFSRLNLLSNKRK